MDIVTVPPNFSMRDLTLSFPKARQVPLPGYGQTPVRTNRKPVRMPSQAPSAAVGVEVAFSRWPRHCGVGSGLINLLMSTWAHLARSAIRAGMLLLP